MLKIIIAVALLATILVQNSCAKVDWTDYNNLQEINQWLLEMAERYPKIVTIVNLGKSYEKRDILGVKISHKAKNKAVFIEGGMHANEWIGPATATFIINELLTSNSSEVQHLAQNYDWHIVPSVNVDGYAFSLKEGDIEWRKTRQPHGAFIGADPNRNFDIDWNSTHRVTFPGFANFSGPFPFSEPETRALSNYVLKIEDLRAYFSFHCAGQVILLPYGYTEKHPENYDDLMKITEVVTNSTKYEAFPINKLSIIPGVSIDWVYDKVGVKLAFIFEQRPQHGFLLPKEEIIANGEEIRDSLIGVLKSGSELGYFD